MEVSALINTTSSIQIVLNAVIYSVDSLNGLLVLFRLQLEQVSFMWCTKVEGNALENLVETVDIRIDMSKILEDLVSFSRAYKTVAGSLFKAS